MNAQTHCHTATAKQAKEVNGYRLLSSYFAMVCHVDRLLNGLILYCLIPLWIVAGFADWLCHRASNISENAGAKESAIHLLMLVEVGIPLLAGLFLEINALVLLVMGDWSGNA